MTKKKTEWHGLTPTEEKIAIKLYKDYNSNYNIDKFSDSEDLKTLIYNEILKMRIQSQLVKLENKGDFPPFKTIESLTKLEDKTLQLKSKLGLSDDKSKEDPLSFLLNLFKKFLFWKEQNLDGRDVTCCWCGKKIFLNIRTDKYDAKKHPYFRGKILANDALWDVFKSEKPLTKEDMARILNTSPDYIDWLEEKLYKFQKSDPNEVNPSK